MANDTGAIEQDVIESMEQFASMWKVFVGQCSGTVIEDPPGLAIRRNASSFPFWHAIFLREPITRSEQLTARLHEAALIYEAKRSFGLTLDLRGIPEHGCAHKSSIRCSRRRVGIGYNGNWNGGRNLPAYQYSSSSFEDRTYHNYRAIT